MTELSRVKPSRTGSMVRRLAAAILLVGSVLARCVVGVGSWWELLIPAALVALFPVIEWCIPVAILHWKPRSLGPVTIDSLLATMSTHSWVLVSEPAESAAALAAIRRFLERHPTTRHSAFELPMQTLVQRATRRGCAS